MQKDNVNENNIELDSDNELSSTFKIINALEENTVELSNMESNFETTANSLFPKKDQAIVFNTIEDVPQIEYIKAFSLITTPKNIKFASRISNNRFCIYFASKNIVDQIITKQLYIVINNIKISYRRLINPAKRIIISNVQPIIPHDIITNAITNIPIRILSPITFMKAGFGNEEYDHIGSFRRQLYIHPEDNEKMPSSILINFDHTDYRIFFSDDTVTCYFCKQTGISDDFSLDLNCEFPTDRGKFSDIKNSNLKRQIISLGPCKPNIKFPLSTTYFEDSEDSKSRTFSHIEAVKLRTIWTKNLTIDQSIEILISKEAQKWRDILTRLIKIILFLTAGNTALQDNERKLSETNPSEGNFIRALICEEIRSAQCYSIIIDSTQDITKIDQVSFIFRYTIVDYKESKLEIKKSFLGFYPLDKHDAEGHVNLIKAVLNTHNLNMSKCRGQGYDGASVMSGCSSGVQKRISDIIPNASFVHCAAHKLDLVLMYLFLFFNNSAPRWATLALGDDVAKIALKKEQILRPFYIVSKKMQSIETNLHITSTDLCNSWGIPVNNITKRKVFSKTFFGDLDGDKRHDIAQENLKVKVFLPVIDTALVQLKYRFLGLHKVVDKFNILQPQNILQFSEENLVKATYDFIIFYEKDISSDFTRQVLSIKKILTDSLSKIKNIKELAKCILENDLGSLYKGVLTACVIFTSLPNTRHSSISRAFFFQAQNYKKLFEELNGTRKTYKYQYTKY
ncbi:hypothetical protein AGLY_000808 [Aphis glycines]|uniref:Uncharacterized protein n=1 Tax=Aphis glycines TaxID=307491 RepID=A0A6G0U807_APHGL|nr:hypothetical protein AGLY_000808 [Aphis glycines]